MTEPLLRLHPELAISRLRVGAEQVPVLIVDNFVDDAALLVEVARQQKFAPLGKFYPGIRAPAPRHYQNLLAKAIVELWDPAGQAHSGGLEFKLCHYSLVTTKPDRLHLLQRIPHFDSTAADGLASIHYLFDADLGGTGFYRHRKTGFETITDERAREYFASLEGENGGPDLPGPQYIQGDTALFERTAAVGSRYNRLVIYPRNVLHSGEIAADFVFDPDPTRGRLSINSFVDLL